MTIPWKDQYKHPAWQKRRLERLDAAGWSCESCGSKDDQLHVHHPQYFKGRSVWEYSDDELQVLCEGCHEVTHATLEKIKTAITHLGPEYLDTALGLLQGFGAGDAPIHVQSYEHATGLGLIYHLSAEEVIDLEGGSGITSDTLMDTCHQKRKVDHGKN